MKPVYPDRPPRVQRERDAEARRCAEAGCKYPPTLCCTAPVRSGICGRQVCAKHRSSRGWCPSHERLSTNGQYKPF